MDENNLPLYVSEVADSRDINYSEFLKVFRINGFDDHTAKIYWHGHWEDFMGTEFQKHNLPEAEVLFSRKSIYPEINGYWGESPFFRYMQAKRNVDTYTKNYEKDLKEYELSQNAGEAGKYWFPMNVKPNPLENNPDYKASCEVIKLYEERSKRKFEEDNHKYVFEGPGSAKLKKIINDAYDTILENTHEDSNYPEIYNYYNKFRTVKERCPVIEDTFIQLKEGWDNSHAFELLATNDTDTETRSFIFTPEQLEKMIRAVDVIRYGEKALDFVRPNAEQIAFGMKNDCSSELICKGYEFYERDDLFRSNPEVFKRPFRVMNLYVGHGETMGVFENQFPAIKQWELETGGRNLEMGVDYLTSVSDLQLDLGYDGLPDTLNNRLALEYFLINRPLKDAISVSEKTFNEVTEKLKQPESPAVYRFLGSIDIGNLIGNLDYNKIRNTIDIVIADKDKNDRACNGGYLCSIGSDVLNNGYNNFNNFMKDYLTDVLTDGDGSMYTTYLNSEHPAVKSKELPFEVKIFCNYLQDKLQNKEKTEENYWKAAKSSMDDLNPDQRSVVLDYLMYTLDFSKKDEYLDYFKTAVNGRDCKVKNIVVFGRGTEKNIEHKNISKDKDFEMER